MHARWVERVRWQSDGVRDGTSKLAVGGGVEIVSHVGRWGRQGRRRKRGSGGYTWDSIWERGAVRKLFSTERSRLTWAHTWRCCLSCRLRLGGGQLRRRTSSHWSGVFKRRVVCLSYCDTSVVLLGLLWRARSVVRKPAAVCHSFHPIRPRLKLGVSLVLRVVLGIRWGILVIVSKRRRRCRQLGSGSRCLGSAHIWQRNDRFDASADGVLRSIHALGGWSGGSSGISHCYRSGLRRHPV